MSIDDLLKRKAPGRDWCDYFRTRMFCVLDGYCPGGPGCPVNEDLFFRLNMPLTAVGS